MNSKDVKSIITYVVSFTKRRWEEYEENWENIEEVFLSRAYEQGGFEFFKFADILKRERIFNINKLGLILEEYYADLKYNREFAGSLSSEFYTNLKTGHYGQVGIKFYKCVENFKGKRGAWYWRQLWQMLVCCNYLKKYYRGSFSYFLTKKFQEFIDSKDIENIDFFQMDEELWDTFKKVKKPWKELYGIGANVFDFIMGDFVEAEFVQDSYKLDSANLYFLKVTGIAGLLNNTLTRENVINFLKELDLPYTLREVNKGIYTYCSETESHNFGYCRKIEKCAYCKINSICEKNISKKTLPNIGF